MNGLALVDTNNLGFAAASRPVLSVGDQHTHAVLGIVRRLRDLRMTAARYTPLFLDDGMSWRHGVIGSYKASRGAPAVTKQEKMLAAVRESWVSQKPLLGEALNLLGVSCMSAHNMEADDLAAIIVRQHAEKRPIMMLSSDKDWIQLIRPNVVWVDLINDRRIGSKTFAERNKSTESVGLGFERDGKWIAIKTPRQWADVKCLMGDTSDEIGGVGGVGIKGAIELVSTYGSVPDFFNMVLERSIDVDKLPKKLRDLANAEAKHDIYYRNSKLMDLEHPKIPKPIGMKLTKPEFDREGFKDFCRTWLFQSILVDFDRWIAPFERTYAEAA